MKINCFEDMEVWQLSRHFVKDIYFRTREGIMSSDRRFCSQLQSAALSIMNNISEGFERPSNKEFIRYLVISKSSAAETRSMLYVIYNIGYLEKNTFDDLMKQILSISKSLSGFIRYLGTSKK